MKQSDWAEVTQYVQAQWPHSPVPDESLAVWYLDVEDLAGRDVLAAVRALARDGREFPPNGGIIRKKVVELAADAPDWRETWDWLRRYYGTGVCNPMYHQSNYFGKDRADHPANRAKRLLERMPPLVAAFVESMTSAQLADAFEQEGGGEARMRDKWTSWERRQEREAGLHGIGPSSLAAVKRINAKHGGPTSLADALLEAASQEHGPDFEIEPRDAA